MFTPGGATAAAAPAAPVVATSAEPSPEPPPEQPPVTANEFLPENRDLSDCVGALERPGCGSGERGGPLLNLVFVLVMAGMAFIFWRIIIGVRKNRAELERTELERTGTERTETEQTGTEQTGTIDP
jgi:hypothetical protein